MSIEELLCERKCLQVLTLLANILNKAIKGFKKSTNSFRNYPYLYSTLHFTMHSSQMPF